MDDPGFFYGVFHYADLGWDTFSVFLGRSPDGLHDWQTVSKLSSNASQAKVWLSPNTSDILVAFETLIGSNQSGIHIAIQHYRNLEQMKSVKPAETVHLPRKLSESAAGTPNFE